MTQKTIRGWAGFITTIIIRNWQIKSLEKAQAIAQALDTLEKEMGIHETLITFEGVFICPDIDIENLCATPMERNIRDMIQPK